MGSLLKPCPRRRTSLRTPASRTVAREPDNWEQGAETDGVRYSWCKSVAFEGKASLCIEKTAQRYFPIFQWLQTVDRRGDRPALRVSAQVKAEKLTKAVVDVLFLDEQNNWVSHEWAVYIGSKADEGIRPPITTERALCGTVQIPKEAKKLCIGLQVYGPGKVWFDDIRPRVRRRREGTNESIEPESDDAQAERIEQGARRVRHRHGSISGTAAPQKDQPDAALWILLEAQASSGQDEGRSHRGCLGSWSICAVNTSTSSNCSISLAEVSDPKPTGRKAKTAGLDAESRLAKEEANNAVGTNNVENRSDSADPRAVPAEAAAAFEPRPSSPAKQAIRRRRGRLLEGPGVRSQRLRGTVQSHLAYDRYGNTTRRSPTTRGYSKATPISPGTWTARTNAWP